MPKKVIKRKLNLLLELRHAIKKRDKKLAKKLLLKNTIVENGKCKSTHTLVHWAILKFADTDVLRILINQGANIYAKNNYNVTPLEMAIQQQHLKAVKLLLDNQAYVDENMYSLLEMAINTESEKLVKLLIDCGAKNRLFKELNVQLELAVEKGLAKMVKIIAPHCKYEASRKQISEVAVLIGGEQFNECLDILLQYGFRLESGCEENDVFVFNSVKRGYLAIIKGLFSLGLNVNMSSDISSLTLLQTACFHSQHKMAEYLLKHGADINHPIGEESSAWLRNVFIGKLRYLIGKPALHIAMEKGDSKMLNILLNHGAQVSYDPNFVDFISRVTQQDHIEILEVFIKHGFNCKAKMTDGKTLLHDAARCKNQATDFHILETPRFKDSIHIKIADLLLKNEADVDAQGPDKETALFTAIRTNNALMVDFLLKSKTNVHHKNIDGNTPFHVAAKISGLHPMIISRLVRYKADINAENRYGTTPFHYACANWNLKSIQLLIDNGANLNKLDHWGQKPIHFAAASLDIAVIKLLMENGVSLNDRGPRRTTPFHILCNQFGAPDMQMLRLFIQNGADVNAVDEDHKTPLFYACRRGNLKTVKMLLALRAKVNHVDNAGETPVFVAAGCSSKVAKFLMNRKTTITTFVTKDYKSLLHALVEEEQFDVIEQYMNKLKIHSNLKDINDRTPLHYATYFGREKTVALLLQHGANINIVDDNKQTPPEIIHAEMLGINRDLSQLLDDVGQYVNMFNNYFRLRRHYVPFWKKMRHLKRVMLVLRRHLIKMKAARMNIIPQNLKYAIYDESNTDIYTDVIDFANLERYELSCEVEVKMLQEITIPETSVTLLDLLIKSSHILASHINLKEIQLFMKEDYMTLSKCFPIYKDLITYRVTEAVRKNKLLKYAHGHSQPNIFFGFPELAINKIFSYCDNKDLVNFNQAVGPVKFLRQSERDNLKILLKTDSYKLLRELMPSEVSDSDEPIESPAKKIKVE